MTILITLTTIGVDCSTFDIYSDIDGFISAFETDVPKASLSTGFSSANVPDGTTVIRVKAKGVCTNYIDINLSATTTTTTTILTTTTTTTIGTISIESQQAGNDSGTWELKVINGNEGDQYKIRATATFSGTGTSVSFSNFNLSSPLDSAHLTRTGALFSLDVNGELIGSYTVDGDGISCLVELLDISENIISSTNFSTSPV